MIPIYAIDGMAGVGKTALAVHAAHSFVGEFPDGQLFVDMRGFTPGQVSTAPADALAELLNADGVHQKQIPVGLAERAALWRARMADRKALLVVDNAAGHDQVEWLLPGSPHCLVLVTSRRRLTGLRAHHAAVLSSLDTLPPDRAVALFRQVSQLAVDARRQRAIAELVRLCGYLPLAIVVLAARAGSGGQWRVDELVEEVRAARNRLDPMTAEDLAVAVAFRPSYEALPAPTARLFRRLSLHPGAETDVYAAAALAGCDASAARRCLDALFDNHLLHQPSRGRYRMHDLVHAFAGSLAAEEPDGGAERATRRLLDYYERAATAAGDALTGLVRDGAAASPPLADARQALRWLGEEKANLMACAAYADRHHLPAYVISLARAMSAYLSRTGPWDQALELQRAAAAAADECGDTGARADAMLAAGVLLRQAGDYAEARRHMRQAMAGYVEAGDTLGEAHVAYEMGSLQRLDDDVVGAGLSLRRALDLYRLLGDRRGVAKALSSTAAVHWLMDDFGRARQDLESALEIYREVEDPAGRAGALFRLGVVKRLTDDYPGATEDLRAALALFGDLGDRLGMADTRHNLGVVARLTGDYALAQQRLGEALAVYDELGDRLGRANALKQLGVVYRLCGDPPSAVAALEKALAIYGELGERFARANVLGALGVARRLTGDLVAAEAALTESLAIYQELGSRLGKSEVDNALGVLYLERGRPVRALDHHRAALGAAEEARSALERANAHRGIAACLRALHQPDEGRHHLRQAWQLYRAIGSPDVDDVAAELER